MPSPLCSLYVIRIVSHNSVFIITALYNPVPSVEDKKRNICIDSFVLTHSQLFPEFVFSSRGFDTVWCHFHSAWRSWVLPVRHILLTVSPTSLCSPGQIFMWPSCWMYNSWPTQFLSALWLWSLASHSGHVDATSTKAPPLWRLLLLLPLQVFSLALTSLTMMLTLYLLYLRFTHLFGNVAKCFFLFYQIWEVFSHYFKKHCCALPSFPGNAIIHMSVSFHFQAWLPGGPSYLCTAVWSAHTGQSVSTGLGKHSCFTC